MTLPQASKWKEIYFVVILESKEKEFTGVIKKKSCGIFTSLGYRPWNFKGCITSFGNSSGEASFCLEFLGVK